MKRSNPYALPYDLFVVDYRPQTEWMWLIPIAFFLGGLGAGLFLVSLLTNFAPGLLLGLLIVLVGKNTAHLLYLGRPERFWRAVLHPESSWISRGFIAMTFFAVFGVLHLVVAFGWVPASSYGALGEPIRIIAALAALVVMVYDGFVLNSSPAIALWNTALLPVLFGTYALMGGTTLTLLISHLGIYRQGPSAELLEGIEVVLILANLAMLAVYVATSLSSSVAAKYSVSRLVKDYSIAFFGGVIVVGLILTLLLSMYFATTRVVYLLYGAAAAELVGDFLVILLVLRSGVFAPLMPQTDF